MKEEVQLVLSTESDAKLLHQMKREAFLPLYEKYHDDETSPAKEDLDKVIRSIQMENSDYYLIRFQRRPVGGVRVAEKQSRIFYISPLFILPEFQKQGIGSAVIQKLFDRYPQAAVWRLDTILQERGNCRLYEGCGFVRTGGENVINEYMTLIDYEKIL